MSRVSILGVHPDVMLGFALVVATVGGPERGAVAGLFAGFVVDSLSGGALGPALITYTVVAYVVGALSDDTTDYSWVVSFTVFVGSIVAVFGFVLAGSVVSDLDAGASRVVWVSFVVAVTNAVLAPFAAKLFRNIWTRRSELAW